MTVQTYVKEYKGTDQNLIKQLNILEKEKEMMQKGFTIYNKKEVTIFEKINSNETEVFVYTPNLEKLIYHCETSY